MLKRLLEVVNRGVMTYATYPVLSKQDYIFRVYPNPREVTILVTRVEVGGRLHLLTINIRCIMSILLLSIFVPMSRVHPRTRKVSNNLDIVAHVSRNGRTEFHLAFYVHHSRRNLYVNLLRTQVPPSNGVHRLEPLIEGSGLSKLLLTTAGGNDRGGNSGV